MSLVPYVQGVVEAKVISSKLKNLYETAHYILEEYSKTYRQIRQKWVVEKLKTYSVGKDLDEAARWRFVKYKMELWAGERNDVIIKGSEGKLIAEIKGMARIKVNRSKDVVERNIALTGELMRYLLDHPQVFESLPDNFELVILPDDDPEMRLYNLELLDAYGSEGKPIVFARIQSRREGVLKQGRPSLYVPVAA